MINAEQSISVHLLAVKSLNINGSALFMNSLLIDSMGRLGKGWYERWFTLGVIICEASFNWNYMWQLLWN